MVPAQRTPLRWLALWALSAAGLLFALASLGRDAGAAEALSPPRLRSPWTAGPGRPSPEPVPRAWESPPSTAAHRSAGAPGHCDTGHAAPAAPRLSLATWLVEGRVTDPGGAPLSGVSVHPSRSAGHRALTDGSGRFAFEVPAALDVLRFSAPGQRLVGPAPRARRGKAIDVTMAPVAAPLSVLVVSARSLAPLKGATVRLEGGSGEWAVGGAGEALVDSLPVDEACSLRVLCDGYVDGSLELTPGRHRGAPVVVELRELPSRASVCGVVLGPGGQPVAGAVLRSGDQTARSGVDGAFRMALTAGRPRTIEAFHPRFGVARVGVDAGRTADVELRLDPAEVVIGNLPGPEVRSVRVVPAGPDGAPDPLAPHWLTARPDAQGSISVPAEVSAGRWFVLDKGGQVLAELPGTGAGRPGPPPSPGS